MNKRIWEEKNLSGHNLSNCICKKPRQPSASNQSETEGVTYECQSFLVHSAGTLIAGTRGLALTCCLGLQKATLWRIKQTQSMCPSVAGQQRAVRKAKRSRAKKQEKLERSTWSDSETYQGWRSELPFRGGRTWGRWGDSRSTWISQHS